jgi:pyridoxal phosphate enzyme (YggS family)
MTDTESIVAENLAAVMDRIAEAARRAGRAPSEVTLVAVTKYVDAALTRAVHRAGCRQLAESRPQGLWAKAEALADLDVRWHLVGHLQRNKIRRTLACAPVIQSVDSLRLLEALEQDASALDAPVELLLEVNVSGDAAKHGFAPDEMPRVVEQLDRFTHLRAWGLMTMAALEGGPTRARRDFAALRTLRDRLVSAGLPAGALAELSMGMSQDFPEAIAEGATLVRVGSALFEGCSIGRG